CSRSPHPDLLSSSIRIQTCAHLLRAGVARMLFVRAVFYKVPAAFTAAFGFRLLFASIWLDFSSIHWSSFDFLKRQRFPSLKAGIFCSPTYLYSVSGLTPRYCEAWR